MISKINKGETMLKQNAKTLVTDIDDAGRGIHKLILAALMTQTLSTTNPITSEESYLYNLCKNYDLLNSSSRMEKIFEANPNFRD
jgi:hypothetical protein